MPFPNVQHVPSQQYQHPVDYAGTVPVSEHDLPPRMRQNVAQTFVYNNEIPVKIEMSANPPGPGGYPAQTAIRHGTTSSSDSGVDMTIPYQTSVWSQSPDSAKPLPNGQLELNVSRVSPEMSSQVSPHTPMVGQYQNGHAHTMEQSNGSGAYGQQHRLLVSPRGFKDEIGTDLVNGSAGGFATFDYTDHPYPSGGETEPFHYCVEARL